MLFKRREPEHRLTRLRVSVLPRRNYGRSIRYFTKRVMRIRATPHAIAAGVAAGAFSSFTPLMGFHFILSFALAFVARGSMIAAALGTAIGNPLTFPAIWAATLAVGRWMLGVQGGGDGAQFGTVVAEHGIAALWVPWIKPMLIGGFPLGLLAAAIVYVCTRTAVSAFQTRRAIRKAQKAMADDPATGKPQLTSGEPASVSHTQPAGNQPA